MTVEYRTGDLFTQGFTAYAHGVNCRGLMGAGIAREFRRRWPGMHNQYAYLCARYRLQLGEVFKWQRHDAEADNTIIYSLATQDRPGRHASLDAVRQTVTWMVDDAEAHGVPEIGLPRIGAGIGGLAWSDVSAVLDDVAGASPVRLVVVSLPA